MVYLIIFLGALLGQLLVVVAKSYYVQQSSKYSLTFLDALKVYTTKYTAPLVVGLITVLIAMFILPDILANTGEDKQYGKVLQNILDYMRGYSVFLGVICQGLGFLIIRKGEKFLRDEEKKLKSDADDKE